VTREEEPTAWNALENLCISRGLKMPTLRLIETEGMNAFASGLHEGRFSVTVTRGLLQNLDRGELEAVLAHELTHIINRDVRTMVVAAIFAGVITLFCQIVYRSIVWGGIWGGGRGQRGNVGLFLLIAMVAGSVELTHNPDAMISALQKVAGHTHLEAPQSMRVMFLEDDDEGVMGLFATHPPVAKRIAALSQYAGGRVAEPRPSPPALSAPPAAAPSSGDPGPWGGRTDEPSGPWS
jgi:heat shock protein HtpX